MLKQFKDFSLFSELGGIIQRLEDKIYTEQTNSPSIIHLDKNDNLKGLEHLDLLYQAILKKICLKINYQSFKARTASVITFHPFILKEFNNRWFVIGRRKKNDPIQNLALDRIISIDYDLDQPYLIEDFNGDEFYKNAIGVSVSPNLPPEKVILFVTQKHAPYVLTKPFHPSQKLIEKDYYGITISLDVQHNFELEKAILGFGDHIKVIAPERLKRNIKDRLSGAIDLYQTEISESGLITSTRQLTKNGFSILNHVYTKREIRKMTKALDNYFREVREPAFGKRKLLKDIPQLKQILLNKNLMQIVSAIDASAFLTKAIYFDKPPQKNWFVNWHQDVPINVTEKIETKGYSSWTKKNGINSVCSPEKISKKTFSIRIHLDDTNKDNGALKIISGSHQKRLTDNEISTITQNSTPYICEVDAGGVQLMKPLLLHASSKTLNQKRRRVIHLEFSSEELPGELDWLEREDLDQ